MKKWSQVLLVTGLFAACGVQGTDAPVTQDPCHIHLAPGEDDQLAIQSALLGAAPGSVICFEAGVYELSDGLSLGVPGLTLRAEEGVVLDFSRQRTPAPGLAIQGDDVAVEGLEFRDPRGTGIRVDGSDNVRLSSIRVHWSRPSPDAVGIDLRSTSNTQVSGVEVSGAGRGIRAEASARLLVTGASLSHNEVGVWIEGGHDVELGETELRSNGVGIALFADGVAGGERARIRGNLVEGSRARGGDPVAGTGIVVAGPFSAEIFENLVRSNDAAGLLVLGPEEAASAFYLSVHDNRFVGNGGGPEPDRDVVVAGESSGFCFERNEGSIQAGEIALDAACPLPPLPALSL